ncbi:hypothetical protein [Streptomyces sp. NPDC048442]|uniref:hypothetical protein n=1 Tax=Streptomyces sp. NPDC048442 TaxID=3154823 RepID=UPI003416D621
MGRRKPGKSKRARREGNGGGQKVWWGEPLVPHPQTGRFDLKASAPPETVLFFEQMEELVPLYGGRVPESAALLDEVMRGDQIGLLNPDGETGSLIPVAEFAQKVGISVEELRLHHHHLHAGGLLSITEQGLISLAMDSSSPTTCSHHAY